MLKFIALSLVLTSAAFAEPLPRAAALDCSKTELNQRDCRYIAELAANDLEGNRTITRAEVVDMPATDVAFFQVRFRFSDGGRDVVELEMEIDTE
jgi:hypothetical protein